VTRRPALSPATDDRHHFIISRRSLCSRITGLCSTSPAAPRSAAEPQLCRIRLRHFSHLSSVNRSGFRLGVVTARFIAHSAAAKYADACNFTTSTLNLSA